MTTEADVDDRGIRQNKKKKNEEKSEQGTLGGLIFEPPRERRFKDETSEGALLRPFFGFFLLFCPIPRSSTSASVVNVGASLFILKSPPYVEMAAG